VSVGARDLDRIRRIRLDILIHERRAQRQGIRRLYQRRTPDDNFFALLAAFSLVNSLVIQPGWLSETALTRKAAMSPGEPSRPL
jgi:hypothetical protein